MNEFKFGINMTGAVSAGAYTAGALSFLIEALDAWQAAKKQGETVPQHKISLVSLSGTSAGGMCAAIAALQLYTAFEESSYSRVSLNRLHESWVNKVTVRDFLGTKDLSVVPDVVSLLDSTVIDEIADYALTPGSYKEREYVSPSLALFLTVTNLFAPSYQIREGAVITNYADYFEFEILRSGCQPTRPRATCDG